MRFRNRPLFAVLALICSLGLVAGACSSDDDGDSSSDDGSEGGGSALDGVSLTVGSKDFTENILLAQMLVQATEAEGADVTDQSNLGGTSVNRDALLAGDIDVYPEYNGTGWTVHLGNQDPSSDPQELYDVTAEADLEQNGIQWVGLSPFNDTYGFAANGDLAEAEGGFDLQGMADYLEANPDASVCMETEFPDRPDGLVLFEEATGYEVPQEQIQILDTGLIYTETASGSCDFGEIFTTDGRITALNLELVEDPGVFILYNVSYTFNDEVYQANAETYTEIVDAILEPLDNDKMAELNAQVDVEGESAEDVAASYLQEIGLT
jgi:osmoprotectant transport system substrate-binding protein